MCGCNGNQEPGTRREAGFEVHLPNGEIRRVETEHDAQMAVQMAGGGTYSKR
jgi:hypothetical protein